MKPRKPRGRAPTAGGETYAFRLFVAGMEVNSALARTNLTRLCEQHLKGRYEIEIVDVLTDAATALQHRVLVTPTLMVIEPPLGITVLGNLNDTRAVLGALRLIESE